MKKIIAIILLTGCANKIEVPKDINVHTDPVKTAPVQVNVAGTVHGDIVVQLLQAVSTDPAIAAAVSQSCNNDPNCKTATTNSILASLTQTLSNLSPTPIPVAK